MENPHTKILIEALELQTFHIVHAKHVEKKFPGSLVASSRNSKQELPFIKKMLH
jgi:hypothetical protein